MISARPSGGGGGGVLFWEKEKGVFGSLTIWLYRFIIEEKDTFFSTAQRSLLVYQILLRCVFEDHAEKSKCKFGECSGLFAKWFYWLTLLLNHAAYWVIQQKEDLVCWIAMFSERFLVYHIVEFCRPCHERKE